ncbi:MAG: recombinase RecT [Vagococcus sp.]|nr:recombinase RecT [Vagococcus sp.]
MTNKIQKQDQKEIIPTREMNNLLKNKGIRTMFEDALADNAGPFVASLIDLYSGDNYLQQCNPQLVVMEALKAATLQLPINKQLGYAYIVPYKQKGELIPQMQIGYKGLIQLAMRSGQFRYLNADKIYEGMTVVTDHLTGQVQITGQPTSDKVIGYFAYMELNNGFSKIHHMTVEEVSAHGQKFSKSFNYSSSTWKTNFDAMAIKTVLRHLLSKYAPLSVEMKKAEMMEQDYESEQSYNDDDVITITDPETGEIYEEEPTNEAPF